MSKFKLPMFLIAAMALSSCETMPDGINKTTAALGGAAVGGLACLLSSANDTECALLVAGGAAAGYALASFVEKGDEEAYNQSRTKALEASAVDQTYTVRSEDTGNEFTTKVANNYENSGGLICRTIDYDYDKETGRTQHTETYCKNDKGVWEPVNV